MVYRLPPLATLRTFEAAARHLSFKKAANELHVTPAAVSQQVKNLETFLGLPLFERSHHRLQLTADGLAMFPDIREGLDCFVSGVERTRHVKRACLNVTAPHSFATRWLVFHMASFAAAHPDVTIRISSSPDNIDGSPALSAQASHSTDPRDETSEVAIRFGTGSYPGFRVEELLRPDYVLVCSPGLITGETPLRTPQDLCRHVLLHDESIPSVEHRPSWREWLKLAGVGGIDSDQGPCFSNSLLVYEAALDGQGLALAIQQHVQADVAAGRLVVPFSITLPSAYAYYLVIDEAVADRAVVTAFRDWMRREIAPHFAL